MLDSGAQPSIVDKRTLTSMGVEYTSYPGHIHGVGATPVATLGKVQLVICIGQGNSFKHTFLVIDTDDSTVILGRDFLSRFKSTEFDWENHKIRLGRNWLPTEANLHGGPILVRAMVLNSVVVDEECSTSKQVWDINPVLDSTQYRALLDILMKYPEVFARDPKRPNITHLTEHVIETGRSRPVKSKYNRVDPWTEKR